MNKKIIGRIDKIDFPKLELYNIDVKIDTGAYTSAIHCSEIIEIDHALLCIFNSDVHQNFGKTEIIFESYSLTNVKSSNGFKENRYKVKSDAIFFGKTYKINLTLSTRDDMRFPVLIGRQFLSKKFIVDVDLENVSYNTKPYEHSYSF
ncbi:peptidase [Seonamhaeicola sp. S2-3]|uniref:ATP-dependent zinc protease family protein n=1 Tax=Seonamhaeicola sp. S2-3 TaxID=1936081 RepID=UPI000972A4B6|nr:RimK/LysX family protein [Seonamhaeicola sp. S2-3]APY11176.1 peptidase [Seonamhaeicola sp. S2-3]